MTSTPAPDPTAPPSPRDLSRIVDELEERTAAEAARERQPENALPDDEIAEGVSGAQDGDVAREVSGAPEPPD